MKIGQRIYVRGSKRADHVGTVLKKFKDSVRIKLPSGTWTLSKGQIKTTHNYGNTKS